MLSPASPPIHLAGQMGNILDFTKDCHLERLPLEAAQDQAFDACAQVLGIRVGHHGRETEGSGEAR